MRRIRMVVGLVAALAALTVVAQASASEFTASAVGKSLPLRLKAIGGEQDIKFGKYLIECEKAKGKGTISESPSKTLTVEVKYNECIDVEGRWEGVEAEPKVTVSPVQLTYYGNGSVGIEEVEVSPITIKIHDTGGCTVHWLAQRVPTKAVEKEELEFSSAIPTLVEEGGHNPTKFPPLGVQTSIMFEDLFKSMSFEYGHNGLCENFPSGIQKNGHLEGKMQVLAQGGNLAF